MMGSAVLTGLIATIASFIVGAGSIIVSGRNRKAEARLADVDASGKVIGQLINENDRLIIQNDLLRKDLELTRVQVHVLLRIANENGVTIRYEDKVLLGLVKYDIGGNDEVDKK